MAGRAVAGRFGDLFLETDGTGATAVFDDHFREAHPNRIVARAAWQRARVSSWGHEDRDEAWPPAGAVAYDGVGESSRHLLGSGDPEAAAAAVTADLASIAAFRRADPAAAASIADHLAEYEAALELLAGLVATLGCPRPHQRGWAKFSEQVTAVMTRAAAGGAAT